jgi:DNA-binding transcriptional LysR family regulator
MHASVLRYFLQVAHSGSIRKAADQLGISASAVNRQILLLEEELRSSLFERHPSGMRLNQSGELLYNHIRSTLLDFDRVRGDIGELLGQVTGEVRIATLSSLVIDFIPSAIEEFARRYPSVRYEVRESLAVEVIDQIVSGEADIGFGFVQFVRGALNVVEEFKHPVGVIVSAKHPLAKQRSVPRSACIKFPIVTHTGSFATLRAIQPMLAAENTAPSIVLRTNSLPIVRQFVKANRGLTFATPLGFKEDLANGSLVYRPFSEKAGELRIGLLTPRTRKIPPATALMAEEFRRAIQEVNRTDFSI